MRMIWGGRRIAPIERFAVKVQVESRQTSRRVFILISSKRNHQHDDDHKYAICRDEWKRCNWANFRKQVAITLSYFTRLHCLISVSQTRLPKPHISILSSSCDHYSTFRRHPNLLMLKVTRYITSFVCICSISLFFRHLQDIIIFNSLLYIHPTRLS